MFFIYNLCPIPIRSGGIKHVSSYLISVVISAVNASSDTIANSVEPVACSRPNIYRESSIFVIKYKICFVFFSFSFNKLLSFYLFRTP